MKTRILFFFVLLSAVSFNGIAQTEYSSTRLIQREGYAYQCDNPRGGYETLYNANDQFTYAKRARKDGVPMDGDYLSGRIRTISMTSALRQSIRNIIEGAFTQAEKDSFRDHTLLVTLIINSTTGNIQEVNFEFPVASFGYAYIPIEKYRQIELSLKQNIVIPLTEAGKKLNFCMFVTSFNE